MGSQSKIPLYEGAKEFTRVKGELTRQRKLEFLRRNCGPSGHKRAKIEAFRAAVVGSRHSALK